MTIVILHKKHDNSCQLYPNAEPALAQSVSITDLAEEFRSVTDTLVKLGIVRLALM